MRKSYILILLAAVSLGILFSGCKSTPKAEEPAPVEQPAPEPQPEPQPQPVSQDALNAALAKAEAARKRAADFDSQSYFQSDWQNAEAAFSAAKNLPKGTADEVQTAAAACDESAAAYDALFDKTIPLYAQAREDEIVAARDELIATGLTYDYPEPLESADQIALQALDQYEAKDYYAARDSAAAALARYQGLNTAAAAYLAREEIVDNSLASYDQANFDTADEVGLAAVDAYNAGDFSGASDKAEEALQRYNIVLNTGWASRIGERANAAGTERQKAIELKANVAVREDFNSADAVYNEAGALRQAEQFREAADLYREAQSRFNAAGIAAEDKRIQAEAAIKEAEEKMEASDEAARQAEIIIGGDSL